MIVAVIDLTTENLERDIEYCTSIVKENCPDETLPIIYTLNKFDISSATQIEKAQIHYRSILVSAKTGKNIPELKDLIFETLIGGTPNTASEVVLINQRHYNCLMKAKDSLNNAMNSLDNVSSEFTATELRQAIDSLGEITGKVTSQVILNAIFANFCIGK